MTILEILRKRYGNARLMHYLDGTIGILINNVTWATERNNCAYYTNTNDYVKRHTLTPSLWRDIKHEMVRAKNQSR